MAQIPYPTGTKPLIKPVAKPAGNPADRNFFSGSAVPIAPRTAPTANLVRPSGPTPTNNFFNYTPPAPAAPKDNFLRGSKASFNPYMAQEFAKANADPKPGLRLPQYTPPPMGTLGNTLATGVADIVRMAPPMIASAAGPSASAVVAGGSEALAQWWENQVRLRSGYSQEQLAGTALMGGLFSNWGGKKPPLTAQFPDLPTSGVIQNPRFQGQAPSWYPYSATPETMEGMVARGIQYDKRAFNPLVGLAPDNITHLGAREGRPIVGVNFNGTQENFYKSTGWGRKGTGGQWQVYPGHSRLPYGPRGPVENWFMKDGGGTFLQDEWRNFRNFYGIDTFKNVADNMDQAMVNYFNNKFPNNSYTTNAVDKIMGFLNADFSSFEPQQLLRDPRLKLPIKPSR